MFDHFYGVKRGNETLLFVAWGENRIENCWVKKKNVCEKLCLIFGFNSAKPLKNLLPLPDGGILAEENMDFLLLPLLLYVCSVGLVWIISLFIAVSVVVCESTVQKIALK